MKASQFKPTSGDVELAKVALIRMSPQQEGGPLDTEQNGADQFVAPLGHPKGVVDLPVTMLQETAEGHALTLISG